MEAHKYPTWKDVDIPQGMVDAIKHSNNNSLLSFLANDRVFRLESKINYDYRCNRCGYSKIIERQYEDYSSCEKCRSESVRGFPFWRLTKSKTSALDSSRIVSRMETNYQIYFGNQQENIVSIRWVGVNFFAKFVCGDEVRDQSPTLAIIKAAILCPFLWNNRFNWRDNIKNDRGNDLHISHLILHWTAM